MNIGKILSNLLSFVVKSRRSGTTTLLKKVAQENDVWVIVPDQRMKAEFGECAITFEELDRAITYSPKPILLDNYTLLQLLDRSLIEYQKLDLATKKRDALIRKISDEIELFKRN